MKPSSVKRGCHRAGSACSARAAWAPACAQSRLTGRTGGGAACARAPCAASRRALPPPARKRASSARDHQRPSPARLPRHSMLCAQLLLGSGHWHQCMAGVPPARLSLTGVPRFTPYLALACADRSPPTKEELCFVLSISICRPVAPYLRIDTQHPASPLCICICIQDPTSYAPCFPSPASPVLRCSSPSPSPSPCCFALSNMMSFRPALPFGCAHTIDRLPAFFWIILVGFRYPSLHSYPFHGIPSQAKTA